MLHPQVDRCVLTLLDRRNNAFSTPPTEIVQVLTMLRDLDTAVRSQSPYYQIHTQLQVLKWLQLVSSMFPYTTNREGKNMEEVGAWK